MRAITLRMFVTLLALTLLATTADAQRRAARVTPRPSSQRPMIGPQGGFATNDYDAFIGAQVSYTVAKQVDIYPSFDIYFPGNNVTAWAINGDVRYWPKLNMPHPGLYVGGGLNITHVSVDLGALGSTSDTKAGLGLLGGWQFHTSSLLPFAQLKIVIGDADRVEFGGGLNFKL